MQFEVGDLVQFINHEYSVYNNRFALITSISHTFGNVYNLKFVDNGNTISSTKINFKKINKKLKSFV